ncbi:MAG: 16S rRNA processing protein RimM [Alphaproteobacteria bacterium]|nr:16S rRNA processing protein RimM [Alphaproteobacteria bacterium]
MARLPPRPEGARICVAAVAGAHGVRGDVRLKCFTAAPEDVAAYGPVESEDGARRFTVTLVRPLKDGFSARLSGIGTREAAEALKSTRLYVPRDALPEPAEDEFYHADLIGLAAVGEDGTPFGRVKAVHDFGAGDVLEIAREGAATLMIPFTREAVPQIDLSGACLVVSGLAIADASPGTSDAEPAP